MCAATRITLTPRAYVVDSVGIFQTRATLEVSQQRSQRLEIFDKADSKPYCSEGLSGPTRWTWYLLRRFNDEMLLSPLIRDRFM